MSNCDSALGRPSMEVFRYSSRPGWRRSGSCRACSWATAITSLLGSRARTLSVSWSRAALSAKMPPPQPTSRYRRFFVAGESGCDLIQEEMKSWRKGFI